MRMLILPYLPSTPFFSTLDFTFDKLIFFLKNNKTFSQGELQSNNNNATEQLIVKQEIWKNYKQKEKEKRERYED